MKKTIPSLLVALSTTVTSFGSTLYWYPSSSPQGGTGTWDTTVTRWSTTSGSKTVSAAAPTTGDSVVFGGTAGTVSIAGAASGIELGDWKVETAGYIFKTSTNPIEVNVNSFSGSALSSAIFEAGGTQGLRLKTRGDTAFTGTIRNGSGTLSLAKTGAGRLDLSQATLSYTGATTINEGSLWLAASSLSALTGAVNLGNGANLEGNLVVVGNGVDASSITRTISAGIVLGGNNDNSSAGFGARNGNLILNFGGALAQASWGAAGFRATTFTLGTTDSTHTVILENSVSVDADDRILKIENGTAAIDAELKGALKTSSANRLLTKSGEGTALFSGDSTAFAGRLNISEGKALLDGSLTSATTDTGYGVNVASGATLGGDGTLTLSSAATKLMVSGVLQAGRGEANQSLTISSNVTLASGSILSFAIKDAASSDQIVRAGGASWLFQADQLVQILNLGNIVEGNSYELITGLDSSFASTYNLGNWRLTDSFVDGIFTFNNGVLSFEVTVVPEPSVYALAGLGVAAAAWASKRRKARLS